MSCRESDDRIVPIVNGLKKTHIFGEKCIWPPFVYVKSALC
jgi:hypothetical protein